MQCQTLYPHQWEAFEHLVPQGRAPTRLGRGAASLSHPTGPRGEVLLTPTWLREAAWSPARPRWEAGQTPTPLRREAVLSPTRLPRVCAWVPPRAWFPTWLPREAA